MTSKWAEVCWGISLGACYIATYMYTYIAWVTYIIVSVTEQMHNWYIVPFAICLVFECSVRGRIAALVFKSGMSPALAVMPQELPRAHSTACSRRDHQSRGGAVCHVWLVSYAAFLYTGILIWGTLAYTRVEMCLSHSFTIPTCSSIQWDLLCRQPVPTLLPVCSNTGLLQHSGLCRKVLWIMQCEKTAAVVQAIQHCMRGAQLCTF